jgi:hypothetical protein
MISLVDITTPELVTETEAEAEGTRIAVRFVGTADGLTYDDLTTYLDELQRAALESNAHEIVFDVRALDFMSASCLRSLLAWLGELNKPAVRAASGRGELDRSSPSCHARFVSDARKEWQRRSFEGLAAFDGEHVHIDAV